MTADERRRMRETLSAALTRALLPDRGLEHPPVPEQLQHGEIGDDAMDRFTRALTALGGAVHHATTVDEVARVILDRFTPPLAPIALMWDDAQIPVAGLRAALTAAGVAIVRQPEGALTPDDKARLATASVGITGADAALVETGSIVLASGRGRGRLASLLPPIHVAIVDPAGMVASLPVLLASRPTLVTAGSNVVCITGPSRTADIEHTLSRGVHGPKEVHVIFTRGV